MHRTKDFIGLTRAMLLVSLVAGCGQVANEESAHSSANRQDSEQAPEPVSKSAWDFNKAVDPITKRTITTAQAKLKAAQTQEPVIVDLTWSCQEEKNPESMELEANTFLDKLIDGKYVALSQSPTSAVDYRFDGQPNEVSPSFGAVRRDYSNQIKIRLTDRAGRLQDKGLVTIRHTPNEIRVFRVKDFYLIDSDFAIRIPTESGKATVEFSLDDPALKKLFTFCGFTYGQPPPAKKIHEAINPDDGDAPKPPIGKAKNNGASVDAMNSPVTTNIKMDPKHPLRIGQAFYPRESLLADEHGRCVVKVTVGVDGLIRDESIEVSSGYPRLDEACLEGVRGQRVIPATFNGQPVEKTVSIPIVWALS